MQIIMPGKILLLKGPQDGLQEISFIEFTYDISPHYGEPIIRNDLLSITHAEKTLENLDNVDVTGS